MLLFDLRWLLFIFLLILVGAVLLALWLERRLCQGQRGLSIVPVEVQALLKHAPFGLLLLEDAETYRYANPYARHLLELDAPVGRLPEAEWVYFLNEDRRAARQELAATGRYRSVPFPSERFVRWWVTVWNERDLVVLWDATAQQRAEQAARFLVSDLSHELRTPLATILTHLEVIRLPDIPEETRRQSVCLLQGEAQRMVRMAHNLLELSRLETSEEIERRPVNLLALAEEVIAQIGPQAGEQEISISVEADAPLPLTVGDPDRLRQVFLNLLDNVVKFCRPGDRAVVSLRRVPEGIACAVCDTGPGIPARHLPHVTRRFYRGVSEGVASGSGLGLALVEEILRRHQSRLEIESKAEGEETGTCVRFVLPASPESEMEVGE
jgi:signal transduction histidine kinase